MSAVEHEPLGWSWAFRREWTLAISRRWWLALVLGGAGLMAVLGVVLPELLLSSIEPGSDGGLEEELRLSASRPLPTIVLRQTLGVVAPLVAILTARACAAEFETGTWAWTTTLLGVGAVMRMKLLAGLVRGAVLASAGAVVIALLSLFDEPGAGMGSAGTIVRAVIAVLLVLAVAVALGGMLGVLARRTTAAVTSAALLLLVIEPTVRSAVTPQGAWVLLPPASTRALLEGLELGERRWLPMALLALTAGLLSEATIWRVRNCDLLRSSL